MLEWFHVRWFAWRNAAQIADTMKRADERIELLLQQVDARDKAITRATRRIDELEKQKDEAIYAAIKEQHNVRDLEKQLHHANEAFLELQQKLAKLETMGEKEYPVLPASASNGRKRTRKVKVAE